MIYFLYGPESYRSKQELAKLLAELKEKSPTAQVVEFDFDLEDYSYGQFQECYSSNSLFSSTKIVLIRDFFGGGNLEFRDKILEDQKVLKNSASYFIFWDGIFPRKNDKLFTWLQKNAECQEFDYLRTPQLKKWCENELAKYQAKISGEALDFLILSVGPNLWQMANEIKKISHLKNGGEISLAEIKNLIKTNEEVDSFKIIGHLLKGDKAQALIALKKMLKDGGAPQEFLGAIVWQFRAILAMKDATNRKIPYMQAASSMALNPWAAGKAYEYGATESLDRLKDIYSNLAKLDLDIKTGRLDGQAALEVFIAEL